MALQLQYGVDEGPIDECDKGYNVSVLVLPHIGFHGHVLYHNLACVLFFSD